MDKSLKEAFIEEFYCPICLDYFSDPVMLRCHHTFCSKCIGIFFKFSKKLTQWKLHCPLCRSQCLVNCSPNDHPVKFLPNNYIVSSVVSKIKQIESQKIDNNDLEDLDHEEEKKPFCRLHQKNMIKYFCKNCQILVCRVCTIMNHREHELLFPHKVLVTHQREISEQFDTLQSNHKKMDIALNTIQMTIGEIKSRYHEIVDQITKLIDARVVILNEQKQKLIKDLDSIVHYKLKKLAVQNDLIELEFGKSKIILNNAVNVLTEGEAIEKLQLKSSLNQHIESFNKLPVEPEEDDTIIFELPERATEMMIESLGIVEAKSTFAEISYASGECLEETKVDNEARFKVVARSNTGQLMKREGLLNITIEGPNNTIVPSKITDKDTGEYEVTFRPMIKGKHKINIYLRGRPIQKSPFICNVVSYRDYRDAQAKQVFGVYGTSNKEFKSPIGIVCDREGYLYISDCYNHRVQVFGPKGDNIYNHGSPDCRKGYLSNPSGLAYCQQTNRIFICDTGNSRVQMLDLNNKPNEWFSQNTWCQTFVGSESQISGPVKMPYGVAVSAQNQEIAITDTSINSVLIYSKEGKYITSIGDKSGSNRVRKEHTQLNCPCYVFYDPENNLLHISDTKNNRVLIYDRRARSTRINFSESKRNCF
ncbi:E3 ubiquitin-protein ligase TRIM71 [Thelohanellus kitauei]|uniref:E3 ubiquitin-protein ligase TRIM71 n=1 Tax=Thelohanellus kitauei TaxID=669202 RepID=A0A0C2MK68_THEKT|nr:E3 ubiquitin-protein ligase TRIM71 [Thelohanellus kitauei]